MSRWYQPTIGEDSTTMGANAAVKSMCARTGEV
jgi:hypothetical protein